jgi:hypothetical protein
VPEDEVAAHEPAHEPDVDARLAGLHGSARDVADAIAAAVDDTLESDLRTFLRARASDTEVRNKEKEEKTS